MPARGGLGAEAPVPLEPDSRKPGPPPKASGRYRPLGLVSCQSASAACAPFSASAA